jgi:superoxide reductase
MGKIYKCNICGNVIELIHVGGGDLVCCGQLMELLTEKTDDVGQEKHMPVVEKTENGFLVKIGSIPHPMEEKHYIEWVELIIDGASYKKFLKSGDKSEAEFCVQGESVIARAYCNIHGLWKK